MTMAQDTTDAMQNPMSLSDEDFEKLSLDQLQESEDPAEEQVEEQQEAVASNESEDAPESDDSDVDERQEQINMIAQRDFEAPVQQNQAEEQEEAPVQQSSKELDFKQEYEKLLSPFRANGRDIKVDNVEDARRLMQMGANYNKKMAGLKPHLRIVKMLEQNDLLNEEKLSFLIDLEKKNPAAVSKFIQEAKKADLDVSEMVHTDESDSPIYVPNVKAPTDKEMELDTVLEEIKESPSFDRTVSELTNKWDGTSKKILLDQPHLIKVINEHVELGVYDMIRNQVEQERTLGRLEGMDDLTAYKAVGDAIHARGGFAQFLKQQAKGMAINTSGQREATPNRVRGNTEQERNVRDRRMAAAPVRSSGSGSREAINPLALSDAEFEKIASAPFA